jgi:hypothetical protein
MAITRSERAPLVADAIPPALRRRGITQRQVFATCLVGALLVALFASHDTPGWIEHLGDTPFVHRLRDATAAWDDAMGRAGLSHPHEMLRDAMQRVLDWQWH